MAKPNRKAPPSGAGESSGNLILVAVICLAAGLGIGYYFGRVSESSRMPVAVGAQPQAGQSSLMDPSVFLQNEASLKSMLKANPADLNALIPLGNLYYDNGKFAEAVQYYGKALATDPNNVNVRTDLGTCYWNLGQADAAIGEFQKSLGVNPSHAQTLYNLGIVYLHGKNDAVEARKAWERLLATNPDYPERARLQQMLASLTLPETPPAASPTKAGQTDPSKTGSSGMEDLLKRMKKQP